MELLRTQETNQNDFAYINIKSLWNLLDHMAITCMYTQDMHIIQSRWRVQVVNIEAKA